MGLPTGRSACGIYPGVQSHQKAELHLPAIWSLVTSYHNVPCSYSRSGFCGRGDELSAVGVSVRKHNHHSYIEVQAASLKRRVRQRCSDAGCVRTAVTNLCSDPCCVHNSVTTLCSAPSQALSLGRAYYGRYETKPEFPRVRKWAVALASQRLRD